MTNFDLSIFNYIYGLADHQTWLDILGVFFAKYTLYIFLLSVAIWATIGVKANGARLRIALWALAAALVSRFAIVEIIRLILPRPRPYMYFNFEPLISEPLLNSSAFPSGHAAFLFAFITTLSLYNKRAASLYVIAILVGIARVFAGVHWLSDVIAGAVVGIVTALLANLAWRRFRISSQ